MLKVENLSFSYGTEAVLRGLTVEIRSGAITTLMGANGCGKTTLLQLMAKNLRPDSGRITLEGADIRRISLKAFSKSVAMVHQKNTAPDDLTVERLVSYGRLPYRSILKAGLNGEDQEQVDRALALTGLTELRDRQLGALSGGQRQRAFIAMALAQNTKMLLLDEPTTFLDARYQVEILRLIAKLNREEGITIIMVLHDINQALAYADEVIGMLDGEILLQGAPREVITSDSIRRLYGIELPLYRTDGGLCVMIV